MEIALVIPPSAFRIAIKEMHKRIMNCIFVYFFSSVVNALSYCTLPLKGVQNNLSLGLPITHMTLVSLHTKLVTIHAAPTFLKL